MLIIRTNKTAAGNQTGTTYKIFINGTEVFSETDNVNLYKKVIDITPVGTVEAEVTRHFSDIDDMVKRIPLTVAPGISNIINQRSQTDVNDNRMDLSLYRHNEHPSSLSEINPQTNTTLTTSVVTRHDVMNSLYKRVSNPVPYLKLVGTTYTLFNSPTFQVGERLTLKDANGAIIEEVHAEGTGTTVVFKDTNLVKGDYILHSSSLGDIKLALLPPVPTTPVYNIETPTVVSVVPTVKYTGIKALINGDGLNPTITMVNGDLTYSGEVEATLAGKQLTEPIIYVALNIVLVVEKGKLYYLDLLTKPEFKEAVFTVTNTLQPHVRRHYSSYVFGKSLYAGDAGVKSVVPLDSRRALYFYLDRVELKYTTDTPNGSPVISKEGEHQVSGQGYPDVLTYLHDKEGKLYVFFNNEDYYLTMDPDTPAFISHTIPKKQIRQIYTDRDNITIVQA